MIFLSDGLAPLTDEAIYDVCRDAVRQGFVLFNFIPSVPLRIY
jgi:hypothetical protein